MKALFVGSGSKGNATLLLSGDTLIEIDAGLTKKRINANLKSWGKSIQDISAIFITHNHKDHVSQLEIIRTPQAAIYASPESLEWSDIHFLDSGVGVDIGPFTVLPFDSHHDAPNPLNFIIFVEDMKIGYVTDTGFIDPVGLSALANCDYYIFESNYEPKLLESSGRPAWLKRRISGKSGHLSNYQASQYLSKLIGENTKGVYLCHLSEECNTPNHAVTHLEHATKKIKWKRKDFFIKPLKQHEAIFAELTK